MTILTEAERSPAALFMAVLAIGFLALSFAAPWWSYDYSSGRKTPEGGFQDPADTQVERHNADFGPFAQSGDAQPSDPGKADDAVRWMGWAVVGAAGALLLAVFGELPWVARWFPRAATLALCALAALAVAAALAIAWFFLPAAMEGYGVDGPFSSELQEDGSMQTTLDYGWIAAALAIPFAAAAFAFKFQAGSHDPASILAVAKRA